MLNIFYGDMPEAIYNTVVYFKNVYEEEWILSERAREKIGKLCYQCFVIAFYL